MQSSQRASALTVLRQGQFARFALCRFLTAFATQMFGVAVGWQVYALTHDALSLGLVGLSGFLPFACLVLVGGHVADRVDRRAVLVVTWAIETLCIGALAWFTIAGGSAVWPFYLVVGTFGATRAFRTPAASAIVPGLVSREDFPHAVALNSALYQVAVIVGPTLGGVLFLVSAGTVLGACLALFGVAVVVAFWLRPLARALESAVPLGTGHAFMQGVRYVLQQRILFGAISLDLFAVLFGGCTALLPIFARDVLHVGPAGLGLLRTAPGVGAALTAGWLALRPISRRAGPVMFGGVAVFGLCTVVFGLSRSLILSMLALTLLGCGDMLSVYIRGVLVQLRAPDEIRGRVSAVSSMFIGASNELGEFESGVTARWLGAVRAVLLGGVATLAVLGIWQRLFPQLRRLDALH